jgi:PhnB protein
MSPHPIPEDSTGVTPYLSVRNAAAAIDFYVRAFGALELMRLAEPSGKIGHAELRIARARIMLADEYPEIPSVGPETLGGTSVGLSIYVEDVDAFVTRAVEAGATLDRPIKDELYGDRSATLMDPFGHRWFFSTRLEDVGPEEVKRRVAQDGA